MKLTILWSGWAIPTPRLNCECENCNTARLDPKLKRNNTSIFVEDGKILVDCPEDIGDSLYRNNISNVEHLFITHWHPDHTFWLRIILESMYDFYLKKTKKPIVLHLSRVIHEDIKKYYPSISYLVDTKGMASIQYIEHGESISINNINITAVWFSGEWSHTFGYIFKSNEKSCLYAPCDTIQVKSEIVEEFFQNLDILIHECGILSSEVKTELSFDGLINRIRSCKPKRTILTHIEEVEVKRWWVVYFQDLLARYPDISFEYAHDGLLICV